MQILPPSSPDHSPPPTEKSSSPVVAPKKKFGWPTIRQMRQIFLLDQRQAEIQPSGLIETNNGNASKPENEDQNKDDIQSHYFQEQSATAAEEKSDSAALPPVLEETAEENTGRSVPDGWANPLKVVLRRESSASDLLEKGSFIYIARIFM